MKTHVIKNELINKIKDSMQWHEALIVKAKSNVKWYHIAPLSKKALLVYGFMDRLERLESWLERTAASSLDVIEIDAYEFNVIFNLKTYKQFLED